MRKKMRFWGLACLLGGCLMLGSCGSEAEDLDIPEVSIVKEQINIPL